MGRSSVGNVLVKIVAPLAALISAVVSAAVFFSGPSTGQPIAEIRLIKRPSEARLEIHALLRNPNQHRESFEGFAIYCVRIGGDETSYETISEEGDPLKAPQIVEPNTAAAVQLVVPYDAAFDACKQVGVLWFNAKGDRLRGPPVPMVSKLVVPASSPHRAGMANG